MRIIYTAAFVCIVMWGFSFIAGTSANVSEILRQGAVTVINYIAVQLNEETGENQDKLAFDVETDDLLQTEERNASLEERVVIEEYEQSSLNSTAPEVTSEPDLSFTHMMDARIPQDVVNGQQKDVAQEVGQNVNQDVAHRELKDFSQERIHQDEQRMAEEGSRAGLEAHRVLNDIATMLGR